jgi:hypothetical protein
MRYTINQIKKKLEEFASNHGQINQFTCKDPLELLNDKESSFPAMVALFQPSNFTRNEVTVNLDLLFMDLVHKDLDNEFEVISDQLQIALDCRAYLNKVENHDNFYISDSGSWTPFYEKGDSEVTGVQIRLTLRINDLRDSCQIP